MPPSQHPAASSYWLLFSINGTKLGPRSRIMWWGWGWGCKQGRNGTRMVHCGPALWWGTRIVWGDQNCVVKLGAHVGLRQGP